MRNSHEACVCGFTPEIKLKLGWVPVEAVAIETGLFATAVGVVAQGAELASGGCLASPLLPPPPSLSSSGSLKSFSFAGVVCVWKKPPFTTRWFRATDCVDYFQVQIALTPLAVLFETGASLGASLAGSSVGVVGVG